MLIDLTFFLFKVSQQSLQMLLAQTFSAVLILLCAIIISKFLKDTLEKSSDNLSNEFINDDFKILIINLVAITIISLFEKSDELQIIDLTLTSFIINQIIYLVMIAVFCLNYYFFFKWIFIRRHRRTVQFTAIVLATIGIVVIMNLMFAFSGEQTKKVISVLTILLIIQTAIFAWFLISKNHWLHSINKTAKIKLIIISLISIITGIKLLSLTSESDISLILFSESLLPGLTTTLFFSVFLFTIINFKIFIVSMISLPSASVMERRSSEISSLTYLNKLVADSLERDDSTLIDTVTNLAVSSIGASGGWSEVYNDGKIRIKSTVNCVADILVLIHEESQLSKFNINNKYPKLINDIGRHSELNQLKFYMPAVNSMVIVPLQNSSERVGTMIIFDNNEYGFEKEDLNLLKAFSDNIKIALDNSKLLKSSLEKERYENELLLARDMQQKLLPNKLPQPENYNLNAFAIPATEVGGDYYDVVYLKDGKPCVLSGDVSGKGISAAFIMAQLKGVVISFAGEVSDVNSLMCKINKILYGQLDKKMFITLSAMKINDSLGTVTIARAGHTPFYIKRKNDVITILPKGIGIGLADSELFDNNIESINIKLLPRDSIIMLTDGVNELVKENGDEIGLAGIAGFISSDEFDVSGIKIDNFLKQIEKKFGIIKQIDDITYVSLTFVPNSV